MKIFASSLTLVSAVLLSACGGGGGALDAAPRATAGGNGIAVGEPAPGAPAKDDFIKLARMAECSDRVNRLFIIDGKQVFWERAGSCPDNSYAYGLYGLTPQALQCSTTDSIAGPRTSCSDESQRALFDTITRNLDLPDLGISKGHRVERVDFMPKDGPLMFNSLMSETYTGIQVAQTHVVRDEDSLRKLWKESYQLQSPAPDMPKIDFTQQMVLAVYAGSRPDGCQMLRFDKVGVSGGVLMVNYRIDALPTLAVCTQALTSMGAMVVVDRIDGPVQFIAN